MTSAGRAASWLLVLTAGCREAGSSGAAGPPADPPAASPPAVVASGPVDPAQLATAVRRALLAEESLSFHGRNVWIDVSGTTVVLSGLVDTQVEHRTVLRIVRATDGVRAVDDRLRVLR